MTDQSMREAFEAHINRQWPKRMLNRRDMQGSARLGEYCDHSIQIAYEAWQAAWSASRAKAADECERMSAQGCDAGDCADALRATGGTG